ncbi:MAG: glutathione S-transferase family protein, partial [Myxococcota bacterium]
AREWARDNDGHFRRTPTTIREWIRKDGTSKHPAAKDRYHLYVSYACPWAHRTLIMRALRKLTDVIGVSVVDHFMGDDGWTFASNPGVIPDPVRNAPFLRDVYTAHDPKFTGRVTVPVLFDRELGTIVNNESRDIIRMLDHEMSGLGDPSVDLCPADLQAKVDATIDENYEPINNGVYRSGFAGSQSAYDLAVGELFDALDRAEDRLSTNRYLCGDRLTEADICLFTTLIRFDKVYHTHFKCNVKRIVDYPNLWGFVREVYQMPGVAETCNFEHITKHYYASHSSINPTRIVARGPDLDLMSPHRRG